MFLQCKNVKQTKQQNKIIKKYSKNVHFESPCIVKFYGEKKNLNFCQC